MILSLLPLLFLAGAAMAQDEDATLTVANGSFFINTSGGNGTLWIDDMNVANILDFLLVCQ
jgi:hypothetical protein